MYEAAILYVNCFLGGWDRCVGVVEKGDVDDFGARRKGVRELAMVGLEDSTTAASVDE